MHKVKIPEPALRANGRLRSRQAPSVHHCGHGLEILPGDLCSSASSARPARRSCMRYCRCATPTNVCCELTARYAMMLSYKVTFVLDGNATNNEDMLRSATCWRRCEVVHVQSRLVSVGRDSLCLHRSP